MSATPHTHEKAVLICSVCGHASPVGDAWELASRGDRTDVTCPDCGTVVVSQPEFDGSETAPIAA
jgi:endogenous inhibitor of DNA gyrase (YacG/DUF329 family)